MFPGSSDHPTSSDRPPELMVGGVCTSACGSEWSVAALLLVKNEKLHVMMLEP